MTCEPHSCYAPIIRLPSAVSAYLGKRPTVLLIGQFDSPFVRRVGIALRLYGMAFEHRPWSVFGDAERIAQYNPLRRVPTLVLDDGEVLVDSAAILDHLDQIAGPERALIAPSGAERRQALRICALAGGMGDKAVSLLYERVLRAQQLDRWVDRCRTQIGDVLDALEADRAGRESVFWFGERIGHADIAVACVVRFAGEAHPHLFGPAQWPTRWPALTAHAGRCEALPPFREIVQPLVPPD